MVGAVTWLDGHVEHIIKEEASRREPSIGKQAVPLGAVVAFDLPDGCPSGWSRFDSAIGRAVVGVGMGQVIGYADVFSPESTYGTGYRETEADRILNPWLSEAAPSSSQAFNQPMTKSKKRNDKEDRKKGPEHHRPPGPRPGPAVPPPGGGGGAVDTYSTTYSTTYAFPTAYEYRFGVIISGVPEYIALYYCKKMNE